MTKQLLFRGFMSEENYPSDEFDSIGSHRDKGQDVGEIKRILNSFLIHIEKDQSNSLLIAATNLPEMLDRALFRRFDEVIEYPLPSEAELAKIIHQTLQGFQLGKAFAPHQLAQYAMGLNYSQIVQACEDAIKEMIIEGAETLSADYLKQAIHKRK